MSTFIGIVTFGNIEFTKLTYRSILETVISPYNVCIVVGKPGDEQTRQWAATNNIPHIVHDKNYGFPYSLNDLYDWGFNHHSYDNFVSIGNDVIAYPNAIDNLINIADNYEYEWICAKEVDVRTLCNAYPEAKKYFDGANYLFNKFDARPWELFTTPSTNNINPPGMSDTHNLSLFKKSIFDKVGYIDVNFYPAYFEDNDLARRCYVANVSSCTLDSYYFHFWSRTIKQGSGGSTNKFFDLNRRFYTIKWGGDFTKETYSFPFNGSPYNLTNNITLQPDIKIASREQEKAIINYWMGQGK